MVNSAGMVNCTIHSLSVDAVSDDSGFLYCVTGAVIAIFSLEFSAGFD